jgi:hypothetical protein
MLTENAVIVVKGDVGSRVPGSSLTNLPFDPGKRRVCVHVDVDNPA